MLERGRLPPPTSFAPPGVKSKSVSWLLSRNPRTMMRLPKPLSMVVVIATASPFDSTIEKWLVPLSMSPGKARRNERSVISFALRSRYSALSRRATGTATKSGSPR